MARRTGAARPARLREVRARRRVRVLPTAGGPVPEAPVSVGGCVRWDAATGQARVHYASTSRRLVDDAARLLLRFNVMTRVRTVRKGRHRVGYRLLVHGADNQQRFLEEIGARGTRATGVERCLAELRGGQGGTHPDTAPVQMWEHVRHTLTERDTAHGGSAATVETRSRGSAVRERVPGRAGLGRVAELLDDADMDMLATNDVFWDEIAEIEPLGVQEVFDATVLESHNFVANGISVHNSIEQDADMVILLYREDVHEKESPRAGEADLIVAKHRNGPTATVTVAFQGHYSRFVDMAPG
nr:DnaB-like helicase C-terminal domain-containing protein [Allosalinactinospora lopnorensis]